MNPQLAAALAQARQTNQAVPVNMGTYTLMAYPNGQVGPQGAGLSGASGTARWTPQQTPQIPTQPVQPSNPFNAAGVQGQVGSPSGPAVRPPTVGPSYTDPTTLQTFSATPGSTAITASGPGYGNGNGTVVPATLPSTPSPTPASAAPVDRHDAVAAQARIYRINHGLATADDSAATDALNAESLAAANAGRTYLNRDLAAQYGQAPAAGVSGPRTDVVNALLMPPSTTGTAYAQQPATQSPYARQPIVLAPTTAQPTQTQPTQAVGRYDWPAAMQANSLLQQGIY